MQVSWPFRSLAAIVVLFGCTLLLLDVAPAGSSTHSSGIRLSYGILRYARSHDAVPVSLAALEAADPQCHQWVKDEWGRSFQYTVESDGTVTVTSLGRDAKPGGNHANTDRVWRLHLKNTSGQWLNPENDADIAQWLANIPPPKY